MAVDTVVKASISTAQQYGQQPPLTIPHFENTQWLSPFIDLFNSFDPNTKSFVLISTVIAIVAIGVGVTFLIISVVRLFLNAFEETRQDKTNPSDIGEVSSVMLTPEDRELSIPPEDDGVSYATLEEIPTDDNDPVLLLNVPPHGANLVVEMHAFNAKKTQLERFIWSAKSESFKRVIAYFKEELDLIRDTLATRVQMYFVDKLGGFADDVPYHQDFVTFKLISKTTRGNLVENIAEYFERGFSQAEDEDTIARRRVDILKNIFFQAYMASNVRSGIINSTILHNILDGITEDLVRSMRRVINFYNREQIELRNTVLMHEEEIEYAYTKIIQMIEDLQSVSKK